MVVTMRIVMIFEKYTYIDIHIYLYIMLNIYTYTYIYITCIYIICNM